MNTDSLALASPTFGNVATIPEEAEAECSAFIVLPGLPLDIQLIIFHRIPLKIRTSLKLVSKSWRDFIGEIGRGIRISREGLVTCYTRYHHPVSTWTTQTPVVSTQTYLISVGSDGREVMDYSFHSYPGSLRLEDTCNGMLLYFGSRKPARRYFSIAALDRNLIKLQDKQLQLPFVKIRYAPGYANNHTVRLLFDGGHSFKVLCHYWGMSGRGDTTTMGVLFNSSTWKWQEFEALILNPHFTEDAVFKPFDYGYPSVLKNGKVYSIWSTCVLIFDEQRVDFELTRLPEDEGAGTKLMFEREGGINLAVLGTEKFNIYDYGGGTWELKHCIRWENVHSDILLANRFTFRPLVFNEEFMVLYFQGRDVQTGEYDVFDYGFNSQRVGRVRNVHPTSMPTFQALLFEYVNLEVFAGPRG